MVEYGSAGACTCPPELDDIDLIAAVDEEASPEVAAHLTACPYCVARVNAIADLQGRLRQRLYRMFCPTSDELAAFAQEHMIPTERDRVGQHLDECVTCRSELAMLAQFNIVPPALPPEAPLPRVVAHLQRIELAPPHPPSLTESHIYQAGMLRIVLSVDRLSGTTPTRLRGRVNGAHRLGQTASLLNHGRVVSSVPLDMNGEFTLDDVIPGEFCLSLRLHDSEVIVEALHLS